MKQGVSSEAGVRLNRHKRRCTHTPRALALVRNSQIFGYRSVPAAIKGQCFRGAACRVSKPPDVESCAVLALGLGLVRVRFMHSLFHCPNCACRFVCSVRRVSKKGGAEV